MNKTRNQKDIVPYQPENQGQLLSSELAESQNVDLDRISQYLVKKVKDSDNIEEISKIVSVLSSEVHKRLGALLFEYILSA